MNPTANKPTLLDTAIPAIKRFFAVEDEPGTVRADAATAHSFAYKTGGQILVRVNPVRQKALEERGRQLRILRDGKVAGAEAVRETKLREAKTRHAAELAAIESEYANIEVTASTEFKAAEQQLLAEFSLPPALEPVPALAAKGA